MEVKSLTEIKNLRGKIALVRVDFNVPIKRWKVTDDWRIIKSLPTIGYLAEKGAKIVLITHLGRPDGKWKRAFSLKPVARHLQKVLGKKVILLKDKVGTLSLARKVEKIKNGGIAMLENIRFYSGEEENDLKFAKELAGLGDLLINDGFAVCHRAGASISGITKYLPSYAGILLQNEIEVLDGLLKKPKKPLVVLIGGAKIETKVGMIESFLKKADQILIGGAIASVFLVAKGYDTGAFQADEKSLEIAKKLLKNKKIILPVDVVVGNVKNPYSARVVRILGDKELADKNNSLVDIGPLTVNAYSNYIKKAQTIVWNGPMGMFEIKEYSHGTMALARLIAARSAGKVLGVIGGGETIEAVRKTKMERYVDWVSTGGGAMLEFLGGNKMPGIEPCIGSRHVAHFLS